MPSRLCAAIIAVGTAVIGLMNPSAGAAELRLEYLALRGGFTGFVIGHYQPVTFNQADVALTARLPWKKKSGPTGFSEHAPWSLQACSSGVTKCLGSSRWYHSMCCAVERTG